MSKRSIEFSTRLARRRKAHTQMSKCARTQRVLSVPVLAIVATLAREKHSSPLARQVLVHRGDLFVVLVGEALELAFGLRPGARRAGAHLELGPELTDDLG